MKTPRVAARENATLKVIVVLKKREAIPRFFDQSIN